MLVNKYMDGLCQIQRIWLNVLDCVLYFSTDFKLFHNKYHTIYLQAHFTEKTFADYFTKTDYRYELTLVEYDGTLSTLMLNT